MSFTRLVLPTDFPFLRRRQSINTSIDWMIYHYSSLVLHTNHRRTESEIFAEWCQCIRQYCSSLFLFVVFFFFFFFCTSHTSFYSTPCFSQYLRICVSESILRSVVAFSMSRVLWLVVVNVTIESCHYCHHARCRKYVNLRKWCTQDFISVLHWNKEVGPQVSR